MTAQHALSVLFCVGFGAGILGINDTSAQTSSAVSELRITVIGCVRRSEHTPVETVGTTITPADETRYMLSNITLVPSDDRAATPGTKSTAALVAESVTAYQLDDSADSLIVPHVGDRVQVTGAVVPAPRSPTGTTGRTESPTVEAIRAPMLRVESLRKISSDSPVCSQ
jgi:hypothetical protein